VAAYLAARSAGDAPLAMATLARRLVAISAAHRLQGERLDTRHPAIRHTWQGLRRQRGTAQRRAAPATWSVIEAMIATTDRASLIGLRDRALLLTGYAAGLRRSELVALAVADLEQLADGLRLTIRRSKTDQEGAGEILGIPCGNVETCQALRDWLDAAQLTSGRIFRSVDRHGHVGEGLSDKAVALIVKWRAAAAGLDPAVYSGHSLRAGMITSAAAGALDRDIQRHSRHKSQAVMQRYIRPASVFQDNVAQIVGL
jgi:integrase